MRMDSMMEMDDDAVSGFCGGSGMAMYMDGFQSAFGRQNTCIALFISAFKLDTAAKFVAGMLGVVALGILAEALVSVRRARAAKGVAGRLEASLGYGLQLALGYLLMLAAMTYAVELFISAVTGVAIGHALFRTDRAAAPPCCAPYVRSSSSGVDAAPLEATLLDGSGLA
jgi:hypothetical protein